MKLHENKQLFSQAVSATAQRMGISNIYVEKDYWVCYALYLIYESKIKDEVIFKGGTALSKCYQLIERFSEDIDLVVLRNDGDTGNKLKTKLKKITNALTLPFKEKEVDGVTNKLGMIRKVAYDYPKSFKGEFGQVRDTIIIEATWLGHFEPYSKKVIASYIYDMMIATNQIEIAKDYLLMPFEVLVLDSKRTICEKIMSLVRFSHTKNAIENLNNKVRHIYDIHQLLKDDDIQNFFNSDEFDDMLLKVANDDILSFKTDNSWLVYHPKEALLFLEVEKTWNQIKSSYQNNFKNLVYGDFPDENEILKTIQTVSDRIKKIDWTLTLD